MTALPHWLSGIRPQLSHMPWRGQQDPERWSLNIWKLHGKNYELRIRPNADSDLQGNPVDRFDFYEADDDGCGDWKEVITHTDARIETDNLEMMACDEVCQAEHGVFACPNVQSAMQKYWDTHVPVHSDAAVWEIKQYLLRHWHALNLIVVMAP